MYPLLAVALILAGLASTGAFFIYQMKGPGKRNIIVELLIGALSSSLLGAGTLFMMLVFGMFP